MCCAPRQAIIKKHRKRVLLVCLKLVLLCVERVMLCMGVHVRVCVMQCEWFMWTCVCLCVCVLCGVCVCTYAGMLRTTLLNICLSCSTCFSLAWIWRCWITAEGPSSVIGGLWWEVCVSKWMRQTCLQDMSYHSISKRSFISLFSVSTGTFANALLDSFIRRSMSLRIWSMRLFLQIWSQLAYGGGKVIYYTE